MEKSKHFSRRSVIAYLKCIAFCIAHEEASPNDTLTDLNKGSEGLAPVPLLLPRFSKDCIYFHQEGYSDVVSLDPVTCYHKLCDS